MTGPQARIRLLLADHDRRTRALRTALLALLPEGDIEVTAQAATGPQTLALAVAHRPDVVLADLDLPGLDGIRVTEALRTLLPDTRTVLLTDRPHPTALTRALAAGARGYLPKTTPTTDLAATLRTPPPGRCHTHPDLIADAAPTDPHPAPERRRAGPRNHGNRP
ncbi:response regulator [Kitasatospora sp. NPDC086791]|uniref:response regulator n=1 Tax=Kitasatospora sp. NPDC086791 TaxID=3155178 RepID=UPI003439D3B6